MAETSLQTSGVALLLITLLIASVTDLRSRIIPNWLVAMAALAGLLLAAGRGDLGPALLAGSLAAAPFLAAALIRPESMGMGDVKLVAVLGIFLGQPVWGALAAGLALAGIWGLVLGIWRSQAISGVALPLAPFLAAGVATSLVTSQMLQ